MKERGLSKSQVEAVYAKLRARVERSIHEVDEQFGRKVATALRDQILFELDRRIEADLDELFPGSREVDE